MNPIEVEGRQSEQYVPTYNNNDNNNTHGQLSIYVRADEYVRMISIYKLYMYASGPGRRCLARYRDTTPQLTNCLNRNGYFI